METSERLKKFVKDSGLFLFEPEHDFVNDVHFGWADPALIQSIPGRDDPGGPFLGCDVVDHVVGGKKFIAEAAVTDEMVRDSKAILTARMMVSTLIEQAVFDAYDLPGEIPGPEGGKLCLEREVGVSLSYAVGHPGPTDEHPEKPLLTMRLLLCCARV